MQLCRFNDNRLGLVVEDHVFDVSDILDTLPQYRYPLPRFDPLIARLDELTPQIHARARNAKALPLSNIRTLSPVASPGKIIAAPVNYQSTSLKPAPTLEFIMLIRLRKSKRSVCF
jgi:2,4-didehydro-3-deoxy-L-rhamnonate hydrolase